MSQDNDGIDSDILAELVMAQSASPDKEVEKTDSVVGAACSDSDEINSAEESAILKQI